MSQQEEITIYLEEKRYKLKEIAPILGVNSQRKDLKDGIRNKLNSMGFTEGKDYEFPKGKNGIIIILKVPIEPLDKIIYLTRLLGVDTRTNSLYFCIFTYYLLEDEHFQSMPWAKRVEYLKEKENISISEKTLRNWINILIKQDILYKNINDYTWWSSTRYGSDIIRKEIVENDEELKEYKEWNKEFWLKIDPNVKDKNVVWFSEMWDKFHKKFYKCYRYTFGIWYSEILQELITTYKEYSHR